MPNETKHLLQGTRPTGAATGAAGWAHSGADARTSPHGARRPTGQAAEEEVPDAALRGCGGKPHGIAPSRIPGHGADPPTRSQRVFEILWGRVASGSTPLGRVGGGGWCGRRFRRPTPSGPRPARMCSTTWGTRRRSSPSPTPPRFWAVGPNVPGFEVPVTADDAEQRTGSRGSIRLAVRGGDAGGGADAVDRLSARIARAGRRVVLLALGAAGRSNVGQAAGHVRPRLTRLRRRPVRHDLILQSHRGPTGGGASGGARTCPARLWRYGPTTAGRRYRLGARPAGHGEVNRRRRGTAAPRGSARPLRRAALSVRSACGCGCGCG